MVALAEFGEEGREPRWVVPQPIAIEP